MDYWFAPSQVIPLDAFAIMTLPVSSLQVYSWRLSELDPVFPFAALPLIIEVGAVKDHSRDADASWLHVAQLLERGWAIEGVSIDEPHVASIDASVPFDAAIAATKRFIQRCRTANLKVGLIEYVHPNSPYRVRDVLAFASALHEPLDWLHLDIDKNVEIRPGRRKNWADVRRLVEEAVQYTSVLHEWPVGVIAWPGGASQDYERDTREAVHQLAAMPIHRIIVQSWETDDTDLASQLRRLPRVEANQMEVTT